MAGKPQVTAQFKMDSKGVNKSLQSVGRSFKGFAADVGAKLKAGAVAGMAGVAAGVTAALKNGFDQKVMLEQSETLMKSLMGGADKAREAMAMLNAEAKENPMFSKKQIIQAGANLAMFADGSVKKLNGLVETAQLLSVLNPAQGLEGAAFALKEAAGGDSVSLAERFNISKTQIRNMREAGLEGKALVDAILKAQGVTQDTLGDMGNTMGGQMAKMRNMWDEISLKLIEGFWPRIQKTAEEFLGWIMANKGQIVDVLTTVTEVGIQLFKWTVSAFTWIKDHLAQLAAFFGGWWAHISANFTSEKFLTWLGQMASSAFTLLEGSIWKFVGMMVEKIKAVAPKWFSLAGGDNILKMVNENAASAFAESRASRQAAGDTFGITEGKRQMEIERQRQEAARREKPPVAKLRIDVQGQQIPRQMSAS